MLTAVARAARQTGRPVSILTDLPQIWRGNADPVRVETGVARWHYACRRGWIRASITHLAYDSRRADRHIAQQMADHLELTLPVGWRPVLNLAAGERNRRRIVMQNSCRGARYSSPTKEWAQSAWQQLIHQLPGCEWVQLGTPLDPPLSGVRDLRGRTSLAEAAELMASAACFVGLESGLMHLAAAVETPAVIIYGGRTRPSQTGYPQHRHVTRQPPCAGCGLHDGCPHANACMAIPAEEVAAAVREILP